MTGTLAGVVKEGYVYLSNGALMLYIGKKVGDLMLSWVSQEQGDPQVNGYIEGAPPVPMANLTNKASYAGATSVTLRAPTSVTLKFSTDNTTGASAGLKLTGDLVPGQQAPKGVLGALKMLIAAFGFGPSTNTSSSTGAWTPAWPTPTRAAAGPPTRRRRSWTN